MQFLIQLLGALTGLIAIYFTRLHYKRGNFTVREFCLWLLIWLIFIFVVVVPESARLVTGDLGLSRSSDLAVAAFVVLFSVTFHNYVSNRRQRKRLNKLVQEMALKDLGNDK